MFLWVSFKKIFSDKTKKPDVYKRQALEVISLAVWDASSEMIWYLLGMGLPPYLTLIVTSMVCSFSPRTEANSKPVLALDTFVTSSLSLQTVWLISF